MLNRFQVVDDVSSSFTGTERCQTINANHMGMCRFRTKHDNGYIKVVGELKRFIPAIEAVEMAKGKGNTSPTASSIYCA